MWRLRDPQDNQVKADVVVRDDPSSSNHVTFPQINELHDDIVVSILEFVADAPHERPHEGENFDVFLILACDVLYIKRNGLLNSVSILSIVSSR
jgi:hypothetical protein